MRKCVDVAEDNDDDDDDDDSNNKNNRTTSTIVFLVLSLPLLGKSYCLIWL